MHLVLDRVQCCLEQETLQFPNLGSTYIQGFHLVKIQFQLVWPHPANHYIQALVQDLHSLN